MIDVKHSGNFDNISKFLNTMKKRDARRVLNKYGQRGVDLLSKSTPKNTGKTAASWSYKIYETNGRYELVWLNSNINKGVNIALIIQYGHGTRRGAYIKGIDYINPVMEQLFREMAEDLWKEVVNS